MRLATDAEGEATTVQSTQAEKKQVARGTILESLVIVVLLMAVITIVSACDDSSTQQITSPKSVPIAISTVESHVLWSEYLANRTAADEKYLDRTWIITGIVGMKPREGIGGRQVTLSGVEGPGFIVSGVRCFFDGNVDESKFVALSMGSEARLQGRVVGYFPEEGNFNVIVRGCVIK